MTDVSCALITRKGGEILVTQRGESMSLPMKWEFPGGKVEIGETAEDCIVREIAEELGVEIVVCGRMTAHLYGEGNKAIRLIPFRCEITGGEINLAEHAAFLWLLPGQLGALDWAPADLPVLNDYLYNL